MSDKHIEDIDRFEEARIMEHQVAETSWWWAMLHEIVKGEPKPLAVFEHGWIGPGWRSDSEDGGYRVAPLDNETIIFGAHGRALQQWEVRLIIGAKIQAVCNPSMLALVPPRQSYSIAMRDLRAISCSFTKEDEERGAKWRIRPGRIVLTGWEIPWIEMRSWRDRRIAGQIEKRIDDH